MANYLSKPKFTSANGYNGFDMSQIVKTTGQIGEIRPVYYDMLQPGDKVTFGCTIKTRTTPLDTPAMASFTEHVDWFFVPLEQLFKPFGQMFYGISDFGSDMFTVGNTALKNNVFPNFRLGEIIDWLRGVVPEVVDEAGQSYIISALRLLDSCGFPIASLMPYGSDQDKTQPSSRYAWSVTPWVLLAYQKIWSDIYRISDRRDCDPTMFNMDSQYQQVGTIFNSSRFQRITQMHYVPLNPDFFTHVFRTPMLPVQTNPYEVHNSGIISGLLKGYDFSKGLSPYNEVLVTTADEDGLLNDDGTNYPTQVVAASDNQMIGFDYLYNWRASLAMEKLLEVTRRAGKHYDAQTLAHFGVKVPQGISGEVIPLGSDIQDFSIGDVVSTAASGDEPLGTMAGKGYSFPNGGSKKHSFEAKCHGILMAVHYVKPVVDYRQYGIDPILSKVDTGDFYHSEFDNLGMQPLYNYVGDIRVSSNANLIKGWQYRYADSKIKYNKVYGGLIGFDKNWTTAKSPVGYVGMPYSDYLVKPDFTNDIFTIQVPTTFVGFNLVDSSTIDTNYSRLYEYDPFLHMFNFEVKKASKMSTYSLPKLD